MKILHISDWHGELSLIPQILELSYDVVIASGDMIPNWGRGDRETNEKYQPIWLNKNKDAFAQMIGSRPFLYCEGNHDFVDPCLQLGGTNISYKKVNVLGFDIYGFPAIPYIIGEWNHEHSPTEMRDKVGE